MPSDAEVPIGRDILLITLGFPPARGGIQSWMRERARHVAHRIVVLAPAHAAAAAFDDGEPYPIYRWPALLGNVPGLKRLAQFAFPCWMAVRLLRRFPIRLIECGQALPFGLIAWLFCRARGIPYRVWAYGDDILKPAAVGWTRCPLRAILRAAAGVLTVSEFGRRHVISLGVPPERVAVLYPTPTDAYFQARVGEGCDRTGREAAGPILLTVARLEWRKGIDVVLRMLPALRGHFPTLRYRIVGSGPAWPAWDELARKLGVSDCVHFLGDLSDEQTRREYDLCDLFVLFPTPDVARGEAEGFGMVYLEAAARGRPSVAWRTGGVPEAVLDGETGLVVERGDERAAQDAVLRLLSGREQRERMGAAARARAAQMAQKTRQALTPLDGALGGSHAAGE